MSKKIRNRWIEEESENFSNGLSDEEATCRGEQIFSDEEIEDILEEERELEDLLDHEGPHIDTKW